MGRGRFIRRVNPATRRATTERSHPSDRSVILVAPRALDNPKPLGETKLSPSTHHAPQESGPPPFEPLTAIIRAWTINIHLGD